MHAVQLSDRDRTRTCDPVINSHLLYQLSYAARKGKVAGREGAFNPAAFPETGVGTAA